MVKGGARSADESARGRIDQYGDPLPKDARARLGTVRLRHGASIHFVAFSRNGKHLVAEDSYGKAFLWKVATGENLGGIQGGRYVFIPTDEAIRLSGGSRKIRMLDLATGKVLRRFHDQEEGDRLLSFSPDGRAVASAMADKPLRLWDAATGKQLCQLQSHHGRACSITFSREGRSLAAADGDGTIRIWDVARGQELVRITNAKDCIGSVLVVSPDGKILASARDEIGLWSTTSGEAILRLPGHENRVAGIAFTPDGKTVVSGGWGDKTIRVWDAATGKKLREFGRLGGSIETIAMSPDGKTLASGGDDDTVRLWDVLSGQERCPVEGHQGIVLATRFSPDGSTLIPAGRDARIRVWDTVSGKERGDFRFPKVQVYTAAISRDGSAVATAGNYDDQTVRICSVATGEELARLEHAHSITSLAFAPDGKTLASGAGDDCVYLWEVATGRKLQTLRGHENGGRRGGAWGIPCLAFSPDGQFLASGGDDDTIIIWKVASREKRFRLTGHEGSVVALAFSPDGRTLASGAQDYRIELWEVATGKECGRIVIDFFGVPGLAFSGDGRVLASGGYDKLIRLWDLATCRDDWRLAGHIGPVSTLTFSPDGKTLASGSEDTTILLWDVYESILKEPPPAVHLTRSDLRNRWRDLSCRDATNAYRSLWTLVRARDQTVGFLREQLRPAPSVDERHVARLIADLDDNGFEVREKASHELENLVELAELPLRTALARQPSLEVRHRAEMLLKRLETPITDPDRLQAIRGVAVLEQIASQEARDFLNALAQGAPLALLTREAKQALDRLNRLPPRK
jgi:WD40 repeat protein